MKTKLFTIAMLILLAQHSSGQCARSTPFTADFTFQSNGKNLNGSLNFGFFNSEKLSVQAGGRIYDTQDPGKVNAQKINLIPTATVLLKQRFNGEDSRIVHALGLTAGINNYREASYRFYGAPDGNSFATIGAMVSYSNVQGVTAGFVIMAIF